MFLNINFEAISISRNCKMGPKMKQTSKHIYSMYCECFRKELLFKNLFHNSFQITLFPLHFITKREKEEESIYMFTIYINMFFVC